MNMQRSKVILVAMLLMPLAMPLAGCHPASGDSASKTAEPQAVETPQDQPAMANAEPAMAAAQSEPAADSVNSPAAAPKPSHLPPLPQLSSKGATRVDMRNVDFHTQDDIVLRIRALQGALLRRNSAAPPVFDDKKSFVMRIDSGTIGIRADSLSALMNNYVFAYPGAPLKKIKVSTKGSQLRINAKMHKGIDVPVRILGNLTATPDGKLRLHPTSVKAAGIPAKGFLHMFGLDLSDVIKANAERGVTLDDDDIIMDPERMMPPPAIRGKIASVRVEGDEVIQVFGSGGRVSGRGSNYMYYRGGTLRFGKLTMANADLRIVDADPKTNFDFSIDHYNQQLVAGHSKNTPNFGLVVVMPDYYKVGAASANVTTAPATATPNAAPTASVRSPLKAYTFDGKELFDKETARLRKEKLLKEAGAFLEENPNTVAVVAADRTSMSTEEISQARAAVVRQYLARKFKVDEDRIKTRAGIQDKQGRGSASDKVTIYVYPAGREPRMIAAKAKR